MNTARLLTLCMAAMVVSATMHLVAGETRMLSEHVFTDTQAEVAVNAGAGTNDVRYSIKTITPSGWGPETAGTATIKEGKIGITPLAEAIHILRLELPQPVELRFLAMSPPPELDETLLSARLPLSAAALLGGKPFRILATGDSVTWSGDYLGMFAAMLGRASGNKGVTNVNCSYPGRSVDASIRNFKADLAATKPNLVLLMYGLNDQGAGCPMDGFLEQYEWLAVHAKADLGADIVFMQPTPHIDIPTVARNQSGGKTDASNPPEFAFRTIGFAEALRPLASKLNVPLAETFSAIWRTGGPDIEASAKAMWPVYPQEFSRQYSSILESGGQGDTIHPNALGHLLMAKAIYDAVARPPAKKDLDISGLSRWTKRGIESRVQIKNISTAPVSGKLSVYSRFECGPVALDGSGDFSLGQEESATFVVTWPEVKEPRDLLRFPAIASLAPGNPILSATILSAGRTRVLGIPCPFETATFARGRRVVEKPEADVALGKENVHVGFPKDSEGGRIPLLQEVPGGWAVAELAYCRYARALKGELPLDGDEAKWKGSSWASIGEPFQCRWTGGQDDKRKTPEECFLKWSCAAGKNGFTIAIMAAGSVGSDSFTFFFDPRAPELLGTPGPYYWASGNLAKDGDLKMGKGETSKSAEGLRGAWRAKENGAFLEIFIPYELMDRTAWPESGDLGISIWWGHNGPLGRTHLQWSEDGHPWNTRWYGVVRLAASPDQPMPWVVRVK